MHYRVEAWELTGGQDGIDWFLQFSEERSSAFVIGNKIHVDCQNDGISFNWQCDRVMEMHTDSEGYHNEEETSEIVLEVSESIERVMVYRATSERDAFGIIKEGVPANLQSLLTRNNFNLYLDAARKRHRRMRFIEKCIDTGGKTCFIGVVRSCNGKLKLGEVDLSTPLKGWSRWDVECWRGIVKSPGVVCI